VCLASQTSAIPRRLQIFLVDDASSDGTKQAVSTQFPDVTIIDGNGSLYWNGGMRLAFQHALSIGFDAYLWLNDDTDLSADALDVLLQTEQELRAKGIISIVTGSICDPATRKLTYGGISRVRHAIHFSHSPVQPSDTAPILCQSMNGNCTLVPAEIAERLGNLEPGFQHHFGDIDYGYRATEAGFAVHVAPGFIGTCPTNPLEGTWRDRKAPITKRWKDLMSPKGYRAGEWWLFTRRHYTYLWPIYFLVPYFKASLPSRP
jgi:GT2 family glycosyltransferase